MNLWSNFCKKLAKQELVMVIYVCKEGDPLPGKPKGGVLKRATHCQGNQKVEF